MIVATFVSKHPALIAAAAPKPYPIRITFPAEILTVCLGNN